MKRKLLIIFIVLLVVGTCLSGCSNRKPTVEIDSLQVTYNVKPGSTAVGNTLTTEVRNNSNYTLRFVYVTYSFSNNAPIDKASSLGSINPGNSSELSTLYNVSVDSNSAVSFKTIEYVVQKEDGSSEKIIYNCESNSYEVSDFRG